MGKYFNLLSFLYYNDVNNILSNKINLIKLINKIIIIVYLYICQLIGKI